MDIKEALVKVKPPETGGTLNSNRMQFQKDWAICKLLELQLSENNYVLVMDFHDDILIIDSDDFPTKADFFQVKTKKTGEWKLSELWSVPKGSKSIIGKLIFHTTHFGIDGITLNLISNARYNVTLEDNAISVDLNNICFSQLAESERIKLIDKVQNEHEEVLPDYVNITYLKTVDLGISGHDVYTKGAVASFLDQIVGIHHKVNPTIAYSMLASEIEKRNNHEWTLGSFDEILRYKAMSRTVFQQLIDALIRESREYLEWRTIETELSALGIKERNRIRAKWPIYEMHRLDHNNYLADKVKKRIQRIIETTADDSLVDMMERIYSIYSKQFGFTPDAGIDEHYIKAAILMELKLC